MLSLYDRLQISFHSSSGSFQGCLLQRRVQLLIISISQRRQAQTGQEGGQGQTGSLTRSELVYSVCIQPTKDKFKLPTSSSFRLQPSSPSCYTTRSSASNPSNVITPRQKYSDIIFVTFSIFNKHISITHKMAQTHKPKPPLDVLQGMVNGIVSSPNTLSFTR